MVKPALAGANPDRLFVHDPMNFLGQPLVLPKDLNLIEKAVAEVQAKLLVIDPNSVFFSCNPNSERHVRQALTPLVEYAQYAKLAVLLVRHLNKTNATNLLYQASGSTAWIAAAHCALRTASDPTSSDPHRHLLIPIKTNLPGAPTLSYRTLLGNGQIAIEWLGPSNFTAKDLNKSEYEDGSRLWEAMEILFLILRNGPRPAASVAAKAKFEQVSTRTLQRAKASLRIKSERRVIEWPSWQWYWRLPDEENPLIHYLQEKYAALDAAPQESTETEAIV